MKQKMALEAERRYRSSCAHTVQTLAGEDTFVGFSMFFARASLIANEIGKVLDCSCKGGCKDA